MKITLAHTNMMNISDPNGKTYIGGSQDWYTDYWQRVSGCGPTSASNLIWYMERARAGASRYDGGEMSYYIELMHEMFTFVTPGARGVNTSAIFSGGVEKYAMKHSLNIVPRVLEIPGKLRRRRDICKVRGFITEALQKDAPVAFLNLSNGTVSRLDNWHWVTIIALETDSMKADISDQGLMLENIDISEWLKTSLLGGAMVYLAAEEPAEVNVSVSEFSKEGRLPKVLSIGG